MKLCKVTNCQEIDQRPCRCYCHRHFYASPASAASTAATAVVATTDIIAATAPAHAASATTALPRTLPPLEEMCFRRKK